VRPKDVIAKANAERTPLESMCYITILVPRIQNWVQMHAAMSNILYIGRFRVKKRRLFSQPSPALGTGNRGNVRACALTTLSDLRLSLACLCALLLSRIPSRPNLGICSRWIGVCRTQPNGSDRWTGIDSVCTTGVYWTHAAKVEYLARRERPEAVGGRGEEVHTRHQSLDAHTTGDC